MSTRTELKQRLANLESQTAALKAELERVKEYGSDWDNGNVMQFSMRYDKWGRQYSFAILRASNLWWSTGEAMFNGRKSGTWDEVVSFWKKYNVEPASIMVLNYTGGDLASWVDRRG